MSNSYILQSVKQLFKVLAKFHGTNMLFETFNYFRFSTFVKSLYLLASRQSEEPKKNSVGIFEYILASMLKVFLNM